MPKPTITATTPKTVNVTAGQVVELGVKTSGKQPTLYAEGIDRPLRLTAGESGDLRAFYAAPAGTTRVTAYAGAARPVEFTINAEPAAGESVADTPKE